jgi:hypothetical protein
MRKEFALIMIIIGIGISSVYADSQVSIEQSPGQVTPPITVTDDSSNVLFQILSDGQAIINQFIQFSGSGLTSLRTFVFPDSSGTVIIHNATQTISNKVLDADSNSITNIDDNEIKSNAGIDATKLSSGVVDNSEFDRLDGLVADIQPQLNGKVDNGENVGTGTGQVFKDKSGINLRFKSIKAGNNIAITNNADEILINSTSVGIPKLVRLGSDVSTSSTTCCADATGLSFDVSSGKVYHFKFLVRWDTTNAGRGIGLTLNGPTTSFLTYDVIYPTSTTTGVIHGRNIYNSVTGAADSPALTNNLAIIEGLIQPSADGTLIVRFLVGPTPPAGTFTITVKANSVGFLTEIP